MGTAGFAGGGARCAVILSLRLEALREVRGAVGTTNSGFALASDAWSADSVHHNCRRTGEKRQKSEVLRELRMRACFWTRKRTIEVCDAKGSDRR